jgi:diphthamide biosynthesis enzyme Dph1/Dph2-like protein
MWHIEVFYDAAGYLDIIEQMKNLIKAAGKKSYTLVMGRPNSAKLANFPEVLLNSKLLSFSYED